MILRSQDYCWDAARGPGAGPPASLESVLDVNGWTDVNEWTDINRWTDVNEWTNMNGWTDISRWTDMNK
jgi:hypothetical protein